jgi:hypothetical protein
MILSKHQALLEGSKLWIIPDDAHSPANDRINWLINFQLSKANLHLTPQLSPWIKQCTEECGIETLLLPKNNTILIPVKNSLPTEWLCLLPFEIKMKDWVDSAHKVWMHMNRPPLRVFLPRGAKKEDWQNFWVHLEPNEKLTILLQ